MDEEQIFNFFKRLLLEENYSHTNAAIKTLTFAIEESGEQTITGLNELLKNAAKILESRCEELNSMTGKTPISIKSC
jgi:hypothetical protein